MMRQLVLLLAFVVVVLAATWVVVDDGDFADGNDFLDTQQLHHEQVFMGLVVLAGVLLVLAVWAKG